MKCQEVDFDAATGSKQPGDMKNKIDYIIPLSKQALAIIEGMRPITGHFEYVFWNKSKGQPLSEGASRKALNRLGYKGQFVPHG